MPAAFSEAHDEFLRRLGRSIAVFSQLFAKRGTNWPLGKTLGSFWKPRAPEVLRASPLFDGEWYGRTYRDVVPPQTDPWIHYSRFGWREGRAPGPFFDGAWYLKRHADVADAGLEPLTHYLLHGFDEGREIRMGYGDVVKIDAFGELVPPRRDGRQSSSFDDAPFASDVVFSAYRLWMTRFTERFIDVRRPKERMLLRASDFFAEISAISGKMPDVVVVVGADLNAVNDRDGYIQRISAIDNAIADKSRLYLNVTRKMKGKWRVRQWRPGAVMVTMSPTCPEEVLILNTFLDFGQIYVHSVYPLAHTALRTAVCLGGDRVTADMHGVVPEENMMLGKRERALKFNQIELDVLPRVARIVVVTDAMREHYIAKFNKRDLRTIVCPIFNNTSHTRQINNDEPSKLRVVYAGGTQVWQMVDETVAAIAARVSDCVFTILTPDVELFNKKLEQAGIRSGEVDVRSVYPDDVPAILLTQDYGFLLRGKSIVNRVACPTKLLEYLAADVIPILGETEIGDFVSLGMHYVSLADFLSGRRPSKEERQRMLSANREVYQTLERRAHDGLDAIHKLLSV